MFMFITLYFYIFSFQPFQTDQTVKLLKVKEIQKIILLRAYKLFFSISIQPKPKLLGIQSSFVPILL